MVIIGSRQRFFGCCSTPSTYAGGTPRQSRTTASNQREYIKEYKFGGLSQENSGIGLPFHNGGQRNEEMTD